MVPSVESLADLSLAVESLVVESLADLSLAVESLVVGSLADQLLAVQSTEVVWSAVMAVELSAAGSLVVQ